MLALIGCIQSLCLLCIHANIEYASNYTAQLLFDNRLVEESPKWLMASGRLERAQQVNVNICRRNGLSTATIAETHPMTEKRQTQVRVFSVFACLTAVVCEATTVI